MQLTGRFIFTDLLCESSFAVRSDWVGRVNDDFSLQKGFILIKQFLYGIEPNSQYNNIGFLNCRPYFHGPGSASQLFSKHFCFGKIPSGDYDGAVVPDEVFCNNLTDMAISNDRNF